MYSMMIILASTSIWLGRNQQLQSFWFYITNFYRYPMEIYQANVIGWILWGFFHFRDSDTRGCQRPGAGIGSTDRLSVSSLGVGVGWISR